MIEGRKEASYERNYESSKKACYVGDNAKGLDNSLMAQRISRRGSTRGEREEISSRRKIGRKSYRKKVTQR